jgi:hypothetical protein
VKLVRHSAVRSDQREKRTVLGREVHCIEAPQHAGGAMAMRTG